MATSRLTKASAATLLRLDARATKDISADINDAIDGASSAVARGRHDNARRASVLLLLLRLSNELGAKLRLTIKGHRQDARAAAVARLREEIAAADVASMDVVRWGDGSERVAEDDAQAQLSGDSLATAWRGLAAYSALRALRQGGSPSAAIGQTRGLMKSRIKRTAITETSQAYSDEHRQAAEDAVEYDERFRDGDFAESMNFMVREWSALLDACPSCWPHHGEQTGIGDTFEGGAEPGLMHPRCRCIDILVPRAAALTRAA